MVSTGEKPYTTTKQYKVVNILISGAMKMHESTSFFWKQLGEVKPTLYIGYMESNTVWYSMVCFHQLVAFSLIPVTGKVYLNGTIPSGLV